MQFTVFGSHDELDKMKREIEKINKKNKNLENLLEAQEQYSKRNRSFQKVTVSNFFCETNLELPFQNQDEINKKLREKGSFKKCIATTQAFRLIFQTKNCLQ